MEIVWNPQFWFQVPVSVADKKAEFTAMKWIILASRDKDKEERIYDAIAVELLSAYSNEVLYHYFSALQFPLN